MESAYWVAIRLICLNVFLIFVIGIVNVVSSFLSLMGYVLWCRISQEQKLKNTNIKRKQADTTTLQTSQAIIRSKIVTTLRWTTIRKMVFWCAVIIGHILHPTATTHENFCTCDCRSEHRNGANLYTQSNYFQQLGGTLDDASTQTSADRARPIIGRVLGSLSIWRKRAELGLGFRSDGEHDPCWATTHPRLLPVTKRWKRRIRSSSLHTTLEGPTENVNARSM